LTRDSLIKVLVKLLTVFAYRPSKSNLSTKRLTFFSQISANQYAESAVKFTTVTEGLNMPSDEEELVYGQTPLVEKSFM